MRAYVFSDAALRKHARQFAWLSIDTEKPKNAAFLEKFPIQGWPTLLVVDPAAEKAALRWYGSATVSQLARLLEDGERAVRASGGETAEAALARADRLNAERKAAEAVAAYQEALRLGGPDWPRRPRAVESLTVALQFARERERCATTALQEAPRLPRGPSFANLVNTGLLCTLGAPREASWRAEALGALKPLAEEALRLPNLLADDRSGLYDSLVSIHQEQGDAADARELAGEWLTFLEKEAARAQNPEARAAFDSHRVAAALRLGDPARVLNALVASERDLPDDYNPAARLATVYRELGRYDEALAASARALAKAYGPRRLLVYQVRASIFQKKGDAASARRTLQEAVQYASSLPKTQVSEQQIASLKRQLEALAGNATADPRR